MKKTESSTPDQNGTGILRACIATVMVFGLALIQTSHAQKSTIVIDYTGTLVVSSGAACGSYGISAFDGASFHWTAIADRDAAPIGSTGTSTTFAATITLQLSNAGDYSGTHSPTGNSISEHTSVTYDDSMVLSNGHYFDVSDDDPVEVWMGTLNFPSGVTGGGSPDNKLSTFKSSDITRYAYWTITDGGSGHCYFTVSNGVANGTQDYLFHNGFES